MASLSPLNEVLNFRKAKHLLRRASYVFNKNTINSLVSLSIEEALNQLVISDINTGVAVGQEFLTNPGINSATGANTTTPDTGVNWEGTSNTNFSGSVNAGWGIGDQGAYASSSAANGDCHSEDKMFKLFKKNGANGQYITQTVTLPVGTFNWSFWTKWGALVNWDNDGDKQPTFKIMTDDDATGTWTAVQTTITTQPTETETWVEQTGAFVNDIERQVRIKFHKDGGVNGAETNLNELMYIDDVSFNYASAASTWGEPYDPLPTADPDGYWLSSTELSNTFSGQTRKRRVVSSWWWYNALQQSTLKHKLTFFLHTSFTVSKDGGSGTSTFFYDHIRLLDFFAYGNIKSLTKKITFDNSMLTYLNNTTNNANNPNENYAREFLELFTILKGPQIASGDYTNYTELDVQQAAKVFSGIKTQNDRSIIDEDTNIPRGRISISNHDGTNKTFSHAFDNHTIIGGNTDVSIIGELDSFVEMVFEKDATAISFCRKLYRFFVKSEITTEVENDIILPLAIELRNNNYELLPVVKILLSSQHFFDVDDSDANDEIYGSQVKSPLQMISEISTCFNLNIPNPATNNIDFYRFFNFVHSSYLVSSGLILFSPDSVAGYPAHYQSPDYDRHWFSSNTILGRYKLIESLISGRNNLGNNSLIYAQLDIVNYVKNHITNPSDAIALITELSDLLYPESIDETRKNYFSENLLEGYPAYYWSTTWEEYLNSNDSSVVKSRLDALITAMINAAEFQLS